MKTALVGLGGLLAAALRCNAILGNRDGHYFGPDGGESPGAAAEAGSPAPPPLASCPSTCLRGCVDSQCPIAQEDAAYGEIVDVGMSDGFVYWTVAGGAVAALRRASRSGLQSPTTVYAPDGGTLTGVSVGRDRVAIVEPASGVVLVDESQPDRPRVLRPSTSAPVGFDVALSREGDIVIWTAQEARARLFASDRDGAERASFTLVGPRSSGVALQAGMVFFADPDASRVLGMPLADATNVEMLNVVQGSSPSFLAADDGHFCFSDADQGRISCCARPKCQSDQAATIIADEGPQRVRMDGGWVFWTTSSGALRTCKLEGNGCEPATLVSGIERPVGPAIDARDVCYASAASGAVRCLARP